MHAYYAFIICMHFNTKIIGIFCCFLNFHFFLHNMHACIIKRDFDVSGTKKTCFLKSVKAKKLKKRDFDVWGSQKKYLFKQSVFRDTAIRGHLLQRAILQFVSQNPSPFLKGTHWFSGKTRGSLLLSYYVFNKGPQMGTTDGGREAPPSPAGGGASVAWAWFCLSFVCFLCACARARAVYACMHSMHACIIFMHA